MKKPDSDATQAVVVLLLVGVAVVWLCWVAILVVKHVAPDKPKPSFRDAFTQQERDYMKALAIEQCKEIPNCHLHAGELEWLVNYDTFKGEGP
jgi:hypothetical protein